VEEEGWLGKATDRRDVDRLVVRHLVANLVLVITAGGPRTQILRRVLVGLAISLSFAEL